MVALPTVLAWALGAYRIGAVSSGATSFAPGGRRPCPSNAALGTRLISSRVGFRAGLVFALLPIVSRYGQEARPYAFAALSSLLVLRLLEKPDSIGRAAAYGAALTALGLSHMVALLVLPAHAACFVQITRAKPYLSFQWQRIRNFALATAVSLTLVLALIVVGADQHGDQIGGDGTLSELVGLAQKMVAGSTVGALILGLVIVALALRTAFSARQPLIWVCGPWCHRWF
jgi:mannosyltransferase